MPGRHSIRLELDAVDRKILHELDLNGRVALTTLAKRCRVSKQVAQYRMAQLETKKIIRGYYAMIDTSRIGYTTIRVYLKFRSITAEQYDALISDLKKREKLWAVITISGKWDLALGIAVRNVYDFYDVWEQILNQYLPVIFDYSMSIYSPIYHYPKKYLLAHAGGRSGGSGRGSVRVLGGKEQIEIDDLDAQILSKLALDCRSKLVEMGQQLNVSADTIKNRMRALEHKGIIQGYRAMIDVVLLGYEFYKVDIRLTTLQHMRAITEFCERHPNVYQIDKTIGGETLEIEIHAQSLNNFLAIIKELEHLFPKDIDHYEYYRILSEEKITFMPTK